MLGADLTKTAEQTTASGQCRISLARLALAMDFLEVFPKQHDISCSRSDTVPVNII
jgi:hypothetical protein